MIDKKNLAGRTILITRPQPGADETAQLVRQRGGIPLVAPALEIHPPQDASPLEEAISTLSNYRAVILTSANGARAFVARLPSPTGQEMLPPLYAVGPKTARVLLDAGLHPHTPPPPYDADHLARFITSHLTEKGTGIENARNTGNILFLRGEAGRHGLIEILTRTGYTVDLVIAYRAVAAKALPPEAEQALIDGRVDAVLFFSVRSLNSFTRLLTPDGERALKSSGIIKGALSPRIEKALLERGLGPVVVAEENRAEALLGVVGME